MRASGGSLRTAHGASHVLCIIACISQWFTPAGRCCHAMQAFDLAVARAVADSSVLAELCLPYVRVQGHWVAAKGPDPEVSYG